MKTHSPCLQQCPHNAEGTCQLNEDAECPTIRDQAIKADRGKPMMELIPTSALRSLGNVLTFGAKKYSKNSWQQVETDRYIGALLRHLCAFIDDPNGVDAESGLKHSEHLLCNAAFINDAVMRGAYEDKHTKPLINGIYPRGVYEINHNSP